MTFVLNKRLLPGEKETCKLAFFIIKQLVNDNIVCIYLKLGEFLDQPLCFIKREELRNANTDKGCQVLPTGKYKRYEKLQKNKEKRKKKKRKLTFNMILSEPINTENQVKGLINNYKTSKLIAHLLDEVLASHTKL